MAFYRTNSLAPDPHKQLVDYVKQNQCEALESIVERNDDLLAHEYEDGKTILEQACYDFPAKIQAKTIRKLLELGANPIHSNEQWQFKSALHFAALGQNPTILELILTWFASNKKDVNLTANGNTALHTLIKEVDPVQSTFMDCIRLLVTHGVDIRRGDKKNNTALYWAAKNKQKSAVKYLLAQDAWVTSKEAIELRKLSPIPVFAIIGETQDKTTWEYLRARDESNFLRKIKMANCVNDDDKTEESFLQFACAHNLIDVVTCLSAMDPNKVGVQKKQHPLDIAIQHGHERIVEVLLAQPNIHVPNNILNEIMKRIDYDETPTSNYKATCQLIINHKDAHVNCKDTNGNYPLHYAVKYGGKHVIQQLLSRKASLANRDRFNNLAICDVDYDTLKQHFDGCIEAHPGDRLDKEAMYLTFDYTTLLPSPAAVPPDADCENQSLNEARNQFTKECDVVLHMSKDPDQKQLLQHPLIVSFLNVKWHRVQELFYINFCIYLLFCLSLVLFIANFYDPDESEDTARPMQFGGTHLFLLVTSLLITLRELFQMLLMTGKYLTNIDNYIEVALLIDVYLMLFWHSADDAQKRQLYVVAVLLGALELLFLMGSIPELSTYIIMLRTVSFNFCKFLMFNALLIVAFAFCFLTLFKKTGKKTNSETPSISAGGEQKEEEEDKFFTGFFSSLFKTLVMLTGEFEAGDLDFDKYPITSHLIFVIFVLLIAIILLNLLNGLAVSDTQEIKNEAKLVALTARVQYISYIESIAFVQCLNWNWSKLSTCCQKFYKNDNQITSLNEGAYRSSSNIFMETVSIRNKYINEKNELKVYANQGGRIDIQNEVGAGGKQQKPRNRLCAFAFCKAKLDEGTIKKSRQIVSERLHHQSSDNNGEKDYFDEKLKMFYDALSVLTDKIDKLDAKLTASSQ